VINLDISSYLNSYSITTNFIPPTQYIIPSPGIWLVSYVMRIQSGNSTGALTRFYTRFVAGASTYLATVESGAYSPGYPASTTQAPSNSGTAVLVVTNSTTGIYVQIVLGVYAGPFVLGPESYINLTRIG